MLSADFTGIHIRLPEFHLAFAWIGFVLPCIIASLYLAYRRDGLTKWHWLLWGLATVATFFLALRVTQRGIKMFPMYTLVLFLFYVVPGVWRWRAPQLAAGTIGALTFFSMAIIDLAAALLFTPDGKHPTLGGEGTKDMLLRSPLQIAILWACVQTVLSMRVQRRPRRLLHAPEREILRFHFSLRPGAMATPPATGGAPPPLLYPQKGV